MYPCMTTNQANYYLACKYMAMTEEFDRRLTPHRSPFDSTEAFLVESSARFASNKYALMLRKSLPISSHVLFDEIHKHKEYNAQAWINEFHRLEKSSPCKYCEELSSIECEKCEKHAKEEK